MSQEAESSTTPLQQANYPSVRFWFKRTWVEYFQHEDGAAARGKSQASQTSCVAIQSVYVVAYVETANGQHVEQDRLAASSFYC